MPEVRQGSDDDCWDMMSSDLPPTAAAIGDMHSVGLGEARLGQGKAGQASRMAGCGVDGSTGKKVSKGLCGKL